MSTVFLVYFHIHWYVDYNSLRNFAKILVVNINLALKFHDPFGFLVSSSLAALYSTVKEESYWTRMLPSAEIARVQRKNPRTSKLISGYLAHFLTSRTISIVENCFTHSYWKLLYVFTRASLHIYLRKEVDYFAYEMIKFI
jgi:hypothetical protein